MLRKKPAFIRHIIPSLALLLFLCNKPVNTFSQQVNIPGFSDSSRHSIDSSSRLYIESITVEGNRKTKTYIILREMLLKQGDSVMAGQVYDLLEHSRQLVYNTTLFTSVVIKPSFVEPAHVRIHIEVKEKWYIYPIPQFQLADRNFNEWLNVYDADLNRVIYGLKFIHYNFTGRKDLFRLTLLNGYARNISIGYSAPYSNSKLTKGFSLAMGYTQNREISYKTNYKNKLQQYNNGAFVRNIFSANATYQIRNGYYKREVFYLGYANIHVADSVTNYFNSNYFSKNSPTAQYIDLAYARYFTHVDNVLYPMEGKLHGVALTKRGLGWKGNNNFLSLELSYSRFLPHRKNWYSSWQLYGKMKLPFEQPYINQRALGYGDIYLRGQEYYVVDGVAMALGKYTLRKKLVAFTLPVPIKIKALPNLPFAFYGKSYADAGYCYNKEAYKTRFNNIFLYSGGIGIDIVMFYDIVLEWEYSINQLGEKGLFLHLKGGF